MKKLIIVAGSPNTGKTCTTNILIKNLIKSGYKIDKSFYNNFWDRLDNNGNPTTGGDIILSKNGKKVFVISHGDIVDNINVSFTHVNIDLVDTVVCCSHATRGKKVFQWFYDFISNINPKDTQIIPIYKNLLCHYSRLNEENSQLAEFIQTLI